MLSFTNCAFYLLESKQKPKTTSQVILLFTFILTAVLSKDFTNACDQNFISTSSPKSKNGTFYAPVFLNPLEHVRQCTYNFRALPNERVQVHFEEFNLQGTPPECFHEHLDIFTEIEKPDIQPLIETPFGGRFCGQNAPRERISLYQSLSMVFLSDRKNITEERFMGYYEFIPDDMYTKIGTPNGHGEGKSSLCTFQINGNKFRGKNKSAELFSPTYPGTYPKNIECAYKFVGEPGQRIRLEFRDFDLFYGGAHCPFDRVTVYDGPDDMAEKIGTYCGQMRNLVVFSTENMLYVTFTTLKRTAPVFNRGFFGLFDFSDDFVNLKFISKNSDAEHIRGTECDQKILSKKESNGLVFSPGWPFPYQPQIVCRYFIYGMQDSQNLERVVLSFDKFDIPVGNRDGRNSQKDRCYDGYVKVYIQGQEEEHKYNKHDYKFCGSDTPETIHSPGPRLVLLFKAGNKQGPGFKAQYRFETEYQIPGTPRPGSCHFTYRSTSRLDGRFNSPRHPQNYPNQLNCTYMFLATPHQQVQIVFDHFKVRADNINSNSSLGQWKAYGREQCNNDYIEIYDIHTDQSKQLLGRYCDKSSPGPVVSPRGTVGIQLFLHTDDRDVFSGFKGRYMFIPAKNPFGDCGGNITDSENGFIKSPNYPAKYTSKQRNKENLEGYGALQCHWFIYAKPGHKILLYFDDFEVEGKPAERGCPAAALRVWPWRNKEKTPIELCGDQLDSYKEILSETNVLQLSFYLADKAVGATGFKATWTEIKDLPSCTNPNEFKCRNSSYCISRKLQCNHVRNCGKDDRSDETNCTQETEFNGYMLVGLGFGVASIVGIGMVIYCRRFNNFSRQKKMRRRDHPMIPAHSHFHTCESIGERFANSTSMDSV